jgi:hypothetical protein
VNSKNETVGVKIKIDPPVTDSTAKEHKFGINYTFGTTLINNGIRDNAEAIKEISEN